MSMTVEAALAAGPLDIIGDVHGELDALHALLQQLGYDPDGQHQGDRHLVFVGDLCDRGPDSPGVIELVQRLCEEGRAQCLLGNHELNILLEAGKAGNGWFFAGNHDQLDGKFMDCRAASAVQRLQFPAFFATLPLSLSRADLRVVHAAWDPVSLQTLGNQANGRSARDVYRDYGQRAEQWLRDAGLTDAVKKAYQDWSSTLGRELARVPLLTAIGRMDEHFQMSNPVRVLTSGVEQQARQAFYASGKWRMVERVAWWHDYQDETPVIFGHYWRWSSTQGQQRYSRGEPNLFSGQAVNSWLGPRANAFCVDFSVGARYRERPLGPGEQYLGRLAAVRWPERELVFDDGERLALTVSI
ncbi:MAG: metallophosphoesterase [Gammaproteobacteria bacterium]